MPEIIYDDSIKFPSWKTDLIAKAVSIVRDYERQGYDLTLRQLYYQFVSRDWLPPKWADPKTGSTNNVRSYKNLGTLLGDARMGGVMDWESMVDRTRSMSGNPHWPDVPGFVDSVSRQYSVDRWEGQKYRPEVWVEKDALDGVISVVCRRLDIPSFSCRGYTSLSSIWENAQRLKRVAETGAIPVILHFGDHDPSGLDMSRDIEDRTRKFMDDRGDDLQFRRIALNMDQVKKYSPPENPAKVTDSRFEKYQEEYGDSCWELDALDPTTISDLIESSVDPIRNDKIFKARESEMAEGRRLLNSVSERWEEIVKFIEE